MDNDLLTKLREEFLQKREENARKEAAFNSLMQRKEILENAPIVRDYIELLETIKEAKHGLKDEKQLFLHTLFDYERNGLVDETNGIFLYSGTYVREWDYGIRVEKDDPKAEFDEYIDIESLKTVEVPVEDREAFESKHETIEIDESSPVKYSLYELHRDFMYDAVMEGQEKACQRVLKK